MQRKLSVAILIDAWFPFSGGGQVHVREISKRLSRACRYKIYHPPNSFIITRLIWSLGVIAQVIADHRYRRYDLLHAHAYISGIPGKLLSRILGIPVVYTVHGCNTLDLVALQQRGIPLRVWRWKYWLEQWLLTGMRYNREISVSRHFLSYPNVNISIRVIPNGVETRRFDGLSVAKKARPTLLFVGRDDPIKGLSYLEMAMQIVHKNNPRIRLIKVSGKETWGSLVRIYKSAHLFVLPSLSEGHPLTLLEAWAAKLPVVTTEVGDNPRLVKDGVNGYLVPPADSQALAEAILKAVQNPDLAQMGKRGYNLVKKNYTWQKAARATLRVYREVIRANR